MNRFTLWAALAVATLAWQLPGSRALAQYGAPAARQPATESTPLPSGVGQYQDDREHYGVGFVAPWQPASGMHWRKNARLEYYTRPPAPTWRWFTTGRGCGYDQGIAYGVGYPQIPTPKYGK